MKSKKLLLLACLTLGSSLGADAQIINASQPITPIGINTMHTGIAIAPNEDIQATIYDDGSTYKIQWIEGLTGNILDSDANNGTDPDVAYYGNADALVVAYENGGVIYVDEYFLATLMPVDYVMGSMTPIALGTYPNVDMNSMGDGILCWEDGGTVWACSFAIGGIVPGPPVAIASGFQPDIILLDDGVTVALTYVDPSGSLMIQAFSYSALTGGTYSPIGVWNFPPINFYEYPRIASQRNTAFGWGPATDFTVVAQDQTSPSTTEVHGYFSSGFSFTGPVHVNDDFISCVTYSPLPVVAYERGRVHIAWNQHYTPSCAMIPVGFSGKDILLKEFGPTGMTTTTYEKVNTFASTFIGSATSLSTEYDGFYGINNTNWNEGLVYNDPGDLFWKSRRSTMPSFINEGGPIEERENNFSLAISPVDQTIEVLSESDDFASFQLLDNAGRIVDLKTISNNDNIYSIDISHLSGGMYFLNCSSATSEEVLRILQVTK
jgi:hypothetical protein